MAQSLNLIMLLFVIHFPLILCF